MYGGVTIARIVDRPLQVDPLLSAVQQAGVGGIALFVGTVRDSDHRTEDSADGATGDAQTPDGQQVVCLDYTEHPLATQRLADCADRVAAIDGVQAVAVEHRVGHLVVGDLAVVVAVAAAHRQEAFSGCRRLIDELKAEVPIWKEQTFADGVAEWVGLP